MKQILLLILLTASNDVLAQERIDTLYYNRSGSVVPSPAFAEYYRIALYPADSADPKCSGIFIFRENYGQKGIFRQSIRSMTAGQCLTERSFPTSRMVAYRKNHIIRADYWRGNICSTTRMEC